MKRLLAIIALGSLAALALALAAYVELTKFRPDDEWARMRAALLRLHTARFDAGEHWTGEGGVTTAYARGQLRRTGTRLDAVAEFRAVSSGGEGAYADLSGELRDIDGTRYLTYLPPGPPEAAMAFGEPGTWAAIARAQLPLWGPVLPFARVPVFSEGPARSAWGTESAGRLLRLISQVDVLRFSREEPLAREVRGVRARVLDARFDREAAEALLLDVARAREGREPTDGERVQALREADVLAGAYLRLWIGVEDHLPHRMNLVAWLPGEEREVLDMRLDLSGFDEPFEEKLPDPVVAFRPSLEGSGEGRASFGSLSALPERAAVLPGTRFPASSDPDGDGLDGVLEAFYATDPSRADTDGDGKGDGEEVREGRNPRGTGSLFGFGLD